MTDPSPMLAESAAEHVYNVGRALWSSVLTGDAPAAVALRERMRHPRPGDLVIEITGHRPFDPDSVGRLLRIEGPADLPDRYVIEPLHRPGEEQGWRNSEFVALPDRRSSGQWAPDA